MGLININLAQHPNAVIPLIHSNLKFISTDQTQPTAESLCLDSKYFDYKITFYTCKVAQQNKIIFYSTTQNQSILTTTKNYTLYNASRAKPLLKKSDLSFFKSSQELLVKNGLLVLEGFQDQTK